MKRICLFLSMLFLLVLNLHGYEYFFSQKEMSKSIETRGNTNYDIVHYSGLLNQADPGDPDLPVKTVNLIIPINTEISSVNITSKQELVSGTYLIAPAQPETISGQAPQFVSPNSAVYNSSQLYPASIVKAVNYGYLDGCNKIASISISPLQYQPKEKKLIIHQNISFTFNYKQTTDKIVQPMYRLAKDAVVYDQYFGQVVDNYSQKQYSPIVITHDQAVRQNLFNYLILVPPGYKEAFTEFKTWKEEKGNLVKIVSYDEIGNEYSDDASSPSLTDKAGQIRGYLKKQYQTGALTYVLLVGDEGNLPANQRPTRRVFIDNYNLLPTEDISEDGCPPADLYFSDFNGNWKLHDFQQNNGSVYGKYPYDELDFKNEIFTGRLIIPYAYNSEGVQQVMNWTAKLISYESNPGYGNTDYLNKLYVCQSDQLETLEQNPSSAVFLQQNGFQMTAWDRDDATGLFPSGRSVIDKMKGNALSLLDGHGGKKNFATANGNNTPLQHYANVSSYTYRVYSLDQYPEHLGYEENGNGFDDLFVNYLYQVLWSNSCDQAGYHLDKQSDEICMAHAYTTYTSPGYCGPAFIGATGVLGFNEPTWMLRSKFFELLLSNSSEVSYKTEKLGCALTAAKVLCFTSNVFKRPSLSLHLIGDPEMDFWTEVPSELITTYSGNTVSVRCYNQSNVSSPVANAVVMFFDGNRYYEVFTGNDGNAAVPTLIRNLKGFTVLKPGFLPVRNSVLSGVMAITSEYRSNGNVWLAPGAAITVNQGVNLLMEPNSSINLVPGASLTFAGDCIVKSAVAGFLWNGFKVDRATLKLNGVSISNTRKAVSGSPAYLGMTGNCRITNSNVGVDLTEPLEVNINSTIFESVYSGISILNKSDENDCTVNISNCMLSANHSPLADIKTTGIRILNAGGKASNIKSNVISKFVYGISLSYGNASIVQNNISECFTGLQIFEASPVISGNIIIKNRNGISVLGYAAPVLNPLGTSSSINGGFNRIADNTNYQLSYDLNSSVLLDYGKNDIYSTNPHILLLYKSNSNCKTINIRENYWGANFNPTKPDLYFNLYPTFKFQPYSTTPNTFGVQPQDLPADELLNSFDLALKKEISEDYQTAKTIYTSLLAANPDVAAEILPRLEYTAKEVNRKSDINSDLNTLFGDNKISAFTYYSAAARFAGGNHQDEAEAIFYQLKMDSSQNRNDTLITNINMLDFLWQNQDNKSLKIAGMHEELVSKDIEDYNSKRTKLFNELDGENTEIAAINTVRDYALLQNYPNPFNPTTVIKYTLPKAEQIKLSVYDVNGREIAVLVNGRQQSGLHRVEFDGSKLASGIYFYTLSSDGKNLATQKMMLLK